MYCIPLDSTVSHGLCRHSNLFTADWYSIRLCRLLNFVDTFRFFWGGRRLFCDCHCCCFVMAVSKVTKT